MYFKSFIYALLLLLLIVSCENNIEIIDSPKIETIDIPSTKEKLASEYSLPNHLKTILRKENGILVFKDKDHIVNVTKALEAETNNYINNYFEQFKGLTEEQINDTIEGRFNPNFSL